jgi:hypothetical protein
MLWVRLAGIFCFAQSSLIVLFTFLSSKLREAKNGIKFDFFISSELTKYLYQKLFTPADTFFSDCRSMIIK